MEGCFEQREKGKNRIRGKDRGGHRKSGGAEERSCLWAARRQTQEKDQSCHLAAGARRKKTKKQRSCLAARRDAGEGQEVSMKMQFRVQAADPFSRLNFSKLLFYFCFNNV
ncbi:hypothetical protein ACFX2J_034588 [Malus domestica]